MVKTILLKLNDEQFEELEKRKIAVKAKSWESFIYQSIVNTFIEDELHQIKEHNDARKKKAEAPHA